MIFLVFICAIVFIAFIIYALTDIFEKDAVKKRLDKIAMSSPRVNKNLENSVDLKAELLKLINPITQNISKKLGAVELKQILLQAGKPADLEDIYKLIGLKLIYAGLGLISALFLIIVNTSAVPMMKIMLILVVPIAMFKLPDVNLKRIAKQRMDEIRYNMPDALDLLTVCVEAGLALDASFVKVSEELARTCPVLSFEFGRVTKDIRSGMPRQTAYRNLAVRNNIPDLKTFVALLIQTEKLGTSISQSLRIYADTMRTKRRQRVETLAAQASIKMVMPLVFFVLPAMFVVLLGPAALQFIEVFTK